MKLITGTTRFRLEKESAVAIGKFDGIHRGHQELLKEILACREQGMLAVVFTFDSSASSFFSGQKLGELTTREEKRQCFEKMGIDVLVEFPLNKETAATEPEQFVREILLGNLHMKVLVAGRDVSFGAGGAGDAALLQKLAGEGKYQVKLIDKIRQGDREISSTYLREMVSEGKMEEAARLLGAPYCVRGQVVHGKKLGRTIGMPTINQLPEQEKLLPPYGVYYSQVRMGKECWNGITNIGCKPTVSEEKVVGVETYLYDVSRDFYDCEMEVALLHYKRPEMRFHDVEELKAQMQRDIASGQEYFAKR